MLYFPIFDVFFCFFFRQQNKYRFILISAKGALQFKSPKMTFLRLNMCKYTEISMS